MIRALRVSIGKARVGALLMAVAVVGATAQARGLLYQLPYHWKDDRSQNVDLADFRGQPVVITMAYGACRKICSTTLRRLEELQALADREGIKVNFVVVSLDPKSDTPEAWQDYRKWRKLDRDNWSFLSGSALNTRGLAGHLGISYWVYQDHVVHDFGITLLDAEGNIVRQLKWADTAIEGFLLQPAAGHQTRVN